MASPELEVYITKQKRGGSESVAGSSYLLTYLPLLLEYSLFRQELNALNTPRLT